MGSPHSDFPSVGGSGFRFQITGQRFSSSAAPGRGHICPSPEPLDKTFQSSLHGGGSSSKGLFRGRVSSLLPVLHEPGPQTPCAVCVPAAGAQVQELHPLALQHLLAPFCSLFMSLAPREFSLFLFNLAINLKHFLAIFYSRFLCVWYGRGSTSAVIAVCQECLLTCLSAFILPQISSIGLRGRF